MGKDDDGGGNTPWDRQGDDCAYILRALSTADGFKNWDGFKKDQAFKQIAKKYKKGNLKRNFDKTVQRYNDFKKSGGGGFDECYATLHCCLKVFANLF